MSSRKETVGQKTARVIKENPLITFGVVGTGVCMFGAFYMFRKHRPVECQWFQRGRVAFQGFTVGAIMLSFYKSEEVKKAEKEAQRLADIERFNSLTSTPSQ